MSYYSSDTIAAIATAPGGAARGIVRLSGPATEKGVRTIFRPADQRGDKPHFASKWGLSPFSCAGGVQVSLDGTMRNVPCDLYLWPTDRSYTREPVAEFHTLGSPPLVAALLDAVCRAGERLAEPGEFTLRAFLAGRLDLTQAEAVLGVIDARGPDDLYAAIEQLAGNLARPLERLREQLLMLLAELEAGLDFVEEDIEFISPAELSSRLTTIAVELAAVAAQMSSRHGATSARQIVLIGPPNAGKSSLFNALAQRFAVTAHAASSAIVSDIRGTTRDYLTVPIRLDDNDCEIIDTAGIESAADSSSPFAATAQRLSADRRAHSLLRILCVDASSPDIMANFNTAPAALDVDLIAFTKIDAVPFGVSAPPTDHPHFVATSSFTGAGLDDLCREIAAQLSTAANASRAGCIAATADRCRDSLRLADAAVMRAAQITTRRAGEELTAAEIRIALTELGKVVGAIYTDDLLDRIFRTFCIGK